MNELRWEWCEIDKPGIWAYGGSQKTLEPFDIPSVINNGVVVAIKAWRCYLGPMPKIEPPIVEKKYRIPTDEDAKQRPMVEVRDSEKRKWSGPYELIGVSEGAAYPFFVRATTNKTISSWKFCRMEVAE